jgi:hypothetical protein
MNIISAEHAMFEGIRRIFNRPATALDLVAEDPLLGTLTWSADDESWLGIYGDQSFSLGFQGSRAPSQELRAYALQVLGAPDWLDRTLSQAKALATTNYTTFYTAETASLRFGTIHFYRDSKRGPCAIAALVGGRDCRSWRIEYSGLTCEGIGFDS